MRSEIVYEHYGSFQVAANLHMITGKGAEYKRCNLGWGMAEKLVVNSTDAIHSISSVF